MARAFRSPQIEVLPRRQLRRIHSVARFGAGRLRVASDNGPDFGGAFNLYWLKSVFAAVALLAGLSCGSGTSSLPPAGEPMTIPVPAPLADLAACAIPPRGATPTVVCAGNGLLPQQTLDIQAAINSSIANGVRLLLLPAGEYRLKKTLNIANAHDLVIDGQGVRLVFENALSNSDSRGLSISSARGLTLKNFSVDYDPLPYTQGRVIATSQSPTESIFDVQIDTGYRSDVPFFADSVAFKELSLRPFDAATLRIKRDGLRVIVSRVALLAPGILRFATTDPPVNLTNIAVGDLVATAAFRSSAIYLADSTGTQIDNVTVNTANGSSIEEVGGGGGTDARVCFKAGAPPPGASAQRLLAGTRGGFNSRNVEKGPYIHDSFLERLGDDAIAVSGAVFSIPAIVGKTITFAAADPTLPIGLPPGSAVEIYDKNSLRVRIATTVAAVTPNSITLNDATGIGAGDGLVLLGRSGQGPIIRNNLIRDGDARGILIQTRNAIIENNTLENIYLSGILLSFEFAFYDGGPAPRDTIVRGNILREVAIGRQAQAGFGGITVLAKGKDRLKVVNSRELHSMVLESNSVAGTGNWGLVLTNVEGVAVTNLALSRTNSIRQIPPGTNIGPTPNSAIVVDDSRTVEFRCSNVADQGAFATGLVQFGPLAVPSSIDLTGLKRN